MFSSTSPPQPPSPASESSSSTKLRFPSAGPPCPLGRKSFSTRASSWDPWTPPANSTAPRPPTSKLLPVSQSTQEPTNLRLDLGGAPPLRPLAIVTPSAEAKPPGTRSTTRRSRSCLLAQQNNVEHQATQTTPAERRLPPQPPKASPSSSKFAPSWTPRPTPMEGPSIWLLGLVSPGGTPGNLPRVSNRRPKLLQIFGAATPPHPSRPSNQLTFCLRPPLHLGLVRGPLSCRLPPSLRLSLSPLPPQPSSSPRNLPLPPTVPIQSSSPSTTSPPSTPSPPRFPTPSTTC